MKIEFMGIRGIENQIRKYISDAERLAKGAEWYTLGCYLDGLKTPTELAAAIKELGAAYIEKMKAIRTAAPTVRGDTISIYGPTPEIAPNAPSVEDERFLVLCKKQLLERGYVLASDADKYQEIAEKYPRWVHPARVRGAEAKRWAALHAPDAVTKRIKRK